MVLAWRGMVESCYGAPWTSAERLAALDFCAEIGFNTYLYAPKDDPYHRDRWREPYPAADLAHLGELAERALSLGVRFVCGISPGLSMRFADEAEHAALAAKAAQLFDAGVASFGLLFDDVPTELSSPADVARFGAGTAGEGAAHGYACERFVSDFLRPRGIDEPLFVCPTDYAGVDPSPYRDALAASAPHDVLIAWTGADVVVGTISRDDIDRAAASYRRPLVLWDNFPVNDFDPSRLFLGPLTGRTADVAGSKLYGVLANPMQRADPSRFALATVADWARDAAAYDPATSARAALERVAGAGAADLAPLVRACSAWPPSADQDPELSAAIGHALAGPSAALEIVHDRLAELAAGCRVAHEPRSLVAALRPWLDGAIATAEAGLAAVDLLRAESDDAGRVAQLRQSTRLTLDAAEDHYENVLRPIVPPFVRAVLARTAPPARRDDERPVAVVVTGQSATPGDHFVRELLDRRGFRAERTAEPRDVSDAAVVIVTASADREAIASVADTSAPLVAWRHAVELGLARDVSAKMIAADIEIVDDADPLAAGRSGTVRILRGAAWTSVADIDGTDAHVVARALDGSGATIYRYAAGDTIANGTVAPGARVGLFLGPDGPAPWLLNDHGAALVAAALDSLCAQRA